MPLPILDSQPSRPEFALGPRNLAAVRLLRLSVTDRCNFRCVYCMPEDGVDFHKQGDLLTKPDIIAVARAAASVGIDHYKVTGGRPTVRADLTAIIAGLREIQHQQSDRPLNLRKPVELSLTTNGMLLDKLARELRSAGLDRLTVSWDTMQPQRFDRIARGGAKGLGGLARLRAH